MSNYIFPLSLIGVIYSSRAPLFRTKIAEAMSGREWRVRRWAQPRHLYTIDLDFLRSAASKLELQAIQRFYEAHAGAGEDFLFADPEDSSVSLHGIGVGDGVRTEFQLQRAVQGSVNNVLGSRGPYTAPRTNICTYSWDPANAAWSKLTGAGTGVAPVVTANVGLSPTGTGTAAIVYFNKGAGTTTNDSSYLYSPNAGAPTAGNTLTGSVWLRTADGTTVSVRLRLGSVTSTISVTPTWQRFSVTRPAFAADSDTTPLSIWLRGGWGTNDAALLLVWGAQVELGSTVTDYIPTTTAAVTETPAYWPGSGGGFAPVTEPGADVVPYLDGRLGLRRLCPWARTNLSIRSHEMSDASWGKANATVQANVGTAPDGTATADTMTDDATNAAHYLQGPAATTVVGVPYTASAYFKAGTWPGSAWLGLTGGIAQAIDFSLTTGLPSRIGASVIGYSVSACPNGWWRASVTVLAAATTQRVYAGMGAGNGTYAGTSQTMYVWGAQMEAGTVAGDYLPTTTAAASRTDYTAGPNGTFSLAVAPVTGDVVRWSGSYYKRVRFKEDKLQHDRVVTGYWKGKLDLVEVVPSASLIYVPPPSGLDAMLPYNLR